MSRKPRKRKTPDRSLSQSTQHEIQPPPQQVQAVLRHSSFKGPLPLPSIMAGYDRVVPGAAERILRMAEESVTFQQKIAMAALSALSSDTRRGQWFAFLIATLALITGGVAVLVGHPFAGATIVSTTLAGGVGTFVFIRRKGETPTPLDHENV